MKKATMKTLVDYIEQNDVAELSEVKDELKAELAKGEEKAEANRTLYAELHDKVMECIRTANAPVTAQEIADATGIARGKIVHGLTELWDAEVTKDRTGKAILYGIA
jgi:response regulator of citrate/malate metabolism